MALVSSYNGFIFDYGGVLVSHQTEADQKKMAGIAGIPQPVFTEAYWAERVDYDRDAISGIEYWQKVAQRANQTLSQQAVEDLIEYDNISWMQFDDAMWDWIGQLRAAGKRVAILSNMPRDLGEALKTRTGKLNEFDHVTLSYEVRAAKPDAVIYEHCLGGLDVAPDQTLFFDDRVENVQGAEVLGIRAIQFTTRDEVLLRVRE
jgi:putative hydrolase of the HAD superfamily